MCEEYNNDRRPLGLQEAENVWHEHQRKAATAMTSDIYTNGGLLDRNNSMGYEQPVFYPSTIQQILERDFSYEELKFIAGARLMTMSMADIDRLISLLEKLKEFIKNIPTNGLPTPVTPSTPSWNTPYYGFGGGVQPSYPMEIPKEWMGETPSDISRRQMSPKNWDDHFASLSNDDVQKGPNETDEQSSDEKMPSFLGSAWNTPPVRTRTKKFYGSTGTPFPEKIGKKKDQYKKKVVLSPEGVSSKDDVQKDLNETEDETDKNQKEFTEMLYRSASGTPGPVEPGQLKGIPSLKAILDHPSTDVEINENPVPLTEENKIAEDKDKE